MGIFTKQKETTKQIVPANHRSHKKKNTYKITMSSLMPYSMFTMCRNTPLAITNKNGAQTQPSGGWMHATDFPNPLACEMGAKHTMFKDILGEQISTEIVEYLDKFTNAPVLLLFPHGIHVFDKYEKDYMDHLNHASRRDLEHRIKLRERLFQEFAMQNQK